MQTVAARHPELLRYRAEFPLLERVTYLNTCSLGALSDRSRARLERFLGQWDESGARAWYGPWLEELDALRRDLGGTIGRSGTQIALQPNVSTALAVLASALDPLHRGDERFLRELEARCGVTTRGARPRVVTTALDFPTIGHQWLARRPLGVELGVVPSPDGLTVPLESFQAAIDERTALVATGHVYFTTGAIQDLAALARICHDAGALLLVDGYQATGLLPTDVGALGVDIYVSGTLKWLFGGTGNAFLWVRPELAELLEPTTTGWFGSARQFAFDIANLEFAAGGRKWELGTPSLPSAVIARGGLELVLEIGVDALHERTIDLNGLAIALADEAGLRVGAMRDDDRRGGVVGIRAADPGPIVERLAGRRIIVDSRPGIVRLSPAFYNTEEDVRTAIEALAELVPAIDRAG